MYTKYDEPQEKRLKKILVWHWEFLQQIDQPDNFKMKLKVNKGCSCAQSFQSAFWPPTHKYGHRLPGIWGKPLMSKREQNKLKWKHMGEKKIMQGEENFKKSLIILLEKWDNILLEMGCYFLKKEHSRKQ